MAEVHLDDSAITALMRDPFGPVGRLLFEKATEGFAIAQGIVPVRHGNVWSEATTSASPEGFTKASLHPKLGSTSRGLYGSVNAAFEPTVFLEKPAEQMHFARPFLTTTLWTITPV